MIRFEILSWDLDFDKVGSILGLIDRLGFIKGNELVGGIGDTWLDTATGAVDKFKGAYLQLESDVFYICKLNIKSNLLHLGGFLTP